MSLFFFDQSEESLGEKRLTIRSSSEVTIKPAAMAAAVKTTLKSTANRHQYF